MKHAVALSAHTLNWHQQAGKQQYINVHFCYAHKVGMLTNGLGIVRSISFFDEDFRRKHPEVVSKKTDNPELDKEIVGSVSLRPVLTDFFEKHPTFSYKTFLGDSAFDTYDHYATPCCAMSSTLTELLSPLISAISRYRK